MTRSDLVVEAIAGSLGAIVTAVLSDQTHRLRRQAGAAPADGAPQSPLGKLLEGAAMYFVFRGVMQATRRLAGR